MRNKRLQGQVTAGRWTLPAVTFSCTLCWVLMALLLPGDQPAHENAYGLWQTIRMYLPSTGVEYAISFLLYGVIGYFLIELNNTFTLIRMRASVQTSIYILFVTICPSMHLLYAGDIASVAFLFSVFFLFKSYQELNPSGCIFHSFLFIGAGSLVLPQLIFFAPLWLIGAYRFQSLSLKSLCAALLGWSVPYWFLLGHAFFYEKIDLFYVPFIELSNFEPIFDFRQMPLWEIATLGYLFILYITSYVHSLVAGFEDKIRTRAYLQFLADVSFWLFVFIFLQPLHGINLLPLLLISVSILTAHLFVLTHSKISNLFFIFSLGLLLLLFGFNIWMLL